jgi:hypothetical protein
LDFHQFHRGNYMHKPLFRIAAGSVAAVGGLIVASAMPAGAATAVRAELADTCSGATVAVPCSPTGTPVTFSVTTSGTLSITAPAGTPNLGTSTPGGVGTTIGSPANFGVVTVTDMRGINPAAWTATVYSTNFVNQTSGDSGDVIPASDATYIIPDVGSTTTVGDTTGPTPGVLSPASGLPLAGVTSGSGTLVDNAAAPGITLANGVPVTGGIDTGQAVVTVAGFDGDNGATWNPEIDVHVPGGAVVGTYLGTVTHSVT